MFTDLSKGISENTLPGFGKDKRVFDFSRPFGRRGFRHEDGRLHRPSDHGERS